MASAGGLVVANADLTPAEVNLLFGMREYTLTYNEYADRLPGWVTGPFEDEKVNLHITSPDGVLVVDPVGLVAADPGDPS